MLIVFGVICILLIVGGVIMYACADWDLEGPGIFVTLFAICLLIAVIITAVILGAQLSRGRILDQQIELYQEENSKIEQSIAVTVQEYMNHEEMVFQTPNVSDENLIYLVAAYPELRSSELVNTQMDLYIANNKEIRSLKEKKLELTVIKWWLYFGG